MTYRILSDEQVVRAIADLLDGNEWDAGMLEGIAELVRKTGRLVREPDYEDYAYADEHHCPACGGWHIGPCT